MYDWAFDPAGDWEPEYDQFELPANAVADVLPAFVDGDLLPTADYLSVNAPATEHADDPVKRVTRPTEEYELRAEFTENGVNVEDRFWHEFLDRDVSDPAGTDRPACVDNEVSVTPLTVPTPSPTARRLAGYCKPTFALRGVASGDPARQKLRALLAPDGRSSASARYTRGVNRAFGFSEPLDARTLVH